MKEDYDDIGDLGAYEKESLSEWKAQFNGAPPPPPIPSPCLAAPRLFVDAPLFVFAPFRSPTLVRVGLVSGGLVAWPNADGDLGHNHNRPIGTEKYDVVGKLLKPGEEPTIYPDADVKKDK